MTDKEWADVQLKNCDPKDRDRLQILVDAYLKVRRLCRLRFVRRRGRKK